MAAINEKQLAERGALSMVLDLRQQIEDIQKAYPSVVMAERVYKMKATVAAKAAAGVETAPKASTKAAGGPKKSHHKKKATTLGEVVAAAAEAQSEPQAAPEAVSSEVAEAVAEVPIEAVG